MAYTPTSWTTGDDVTATKLNKLEQGVANAGSALIVTDTNGTLNKTVREIYEAMSGGTPVYISYRDGTITNMSDYMAIEHLMPVVTMFRYANTGSIIYRLAASSATSKTNISGVANPYGPSIALYSASSLDGYPVFYNTIYASASSAEDTRW